MTKQQLTSKCTSLIEKKLIKVLGLISKIALGLTLICLTIGFVLMFIKWSTNEDFRLFMCTETIVGSATGATITTINNLYGFNIGWLCFIMVMIFILTALPYYLIHLLTFKRKIMTPIILVVSVLVFCVIMACLFVRIKYTNLDPRKNHDEGIYRLATPFLSGKKTPSPLGVIALITVVGTFVTAWIPEKKKGKK